MKFIVTTPGLTDLSFRDSPWDSGMSGADIVRFVRTVERLGYDAAMVPEHMVVPNEILPQFGAKWPNAMAAQAFLLGATERLLIVPGIMVLPYYNPINLAKAIATVDHLSCGRVVVAVGVGHARGEFRAMDIEFETRGRRADEYLQAMKVLWTEASPSFAGQFTRFDDVVFAPKPLQKPYPPVWIGGNSQAAMRRAVRHGDLWFPSMIRPSQLPECFAYMRSLPEWEDRGAPLGLHIAAADHNFDSGHRKIAEAGSDRWSTEAVLDAVGALADLGVTWTTLPLRNDTCLQERLDQLQKLAEDVIPHFAEQGRLIENTPPG